MKGHILLFFFFSFHQLDIPLQPVWFAENMRKESKMILLDESESKRFYLDMFGSSCKGKVLSDRKV